MLFLSNIDIDVDCIVLTECWVDSDSSINHIDNYTAFQTTRSINQNDGVIVYVRDCFVNVQAHEPEVTDGNCLVISIDKFTVIASYRPPCYSNPSNYIYALNELLTTIHSENIILAGDININILPERTTGHAAQYITMLAAHGLRQGVDKPTRLGNCLDHFMVKTQKHVKTYIFDPLTDHSPILLYLKDSNLAKNTTEHYKITVNYEQLGADLDKIVWDSFYSSHNVDGISEFLVNTLRQIISNNTSKSILSKKKKPLRPWITASIVRCIRKRDRMHYKLKKFPYDDDLRTQYTRYRNTCNDLTNNLKRSYYETQLNKNENNLRGTWNVIKDMCNIKKGPNKPTELLQTQSNLVDSLNEVNRYFTSIGKDLANTILRKIRQEEGTLATKARKSKGFLHSMALSPTDESEVIQVLSGLKNGSAPGLDNIPASILKKFKFKLASPINHLCNVSFSHGVFPATFKKAAVIPIFKAGDKTLVSNYRPISLLSTLSKILEKLANKRLVRYLELNNILSSNQFGFRANRSTSDAILKLTENITNHIDKGEKCVGIFLDLQKAFDTVSIPILISRLDNIGIRGVPQDWLLSYLSGRSQCARLDGMSSEDATCTYGVPQGSTIAPTLFLVYINELCDATIDKAEVMMFADDTVLLFHERSWTGLEAVCEVGLSRVTAWLEDSLLSLNASKTKYLCFSKTKAGSPKNFKVAIHTFPCNRNVSSRASCSCPELVRSNCIKYLGVTVDENLKWTQHVSSTAKRVRKLIHIFKTLRLVASSKLLMQTYKALCHCILGYAVCAWGGTGSTHMIEVERAQRAVLKVLLSLDFRTPTTIVYENAKVLSVRKIFIFECLRRYHRYVVPGLPISSGRREECPVERTESVFADRHYLYLAPKLYNKIGKDMGMKHLKRLTNFQFKKSVTQWLEGFSYGEIENLIGGLT